MFFVNSIFMRFSNKPETTKEPKNAFFYLVAIIKWMNIDIHLINLNHVCDVKVCRIIVLDKKI